MKLIFHLLERPERTKTCSNYSHQIQLHFKNLSSLFPMTKKNYFLLVVKVREMLNCLSTCSLPGGDPPTQHLLLHEPSSAAKGK